MFAAGKAARPPASGQNDTKSRNTQREERQYFGWPQFQTKWNILSRYFGQTNLNAKRSPSPRPALFPSPTLPISPSPPPPPPSTTSVSWRALSPSPPAPTLYPYPHFLSFLWPVARPSRERFLRAVSLQGRAGPARPPPARRWRRPRGSGSSRTGAASTTRRAPLASRPPSACWRRRSCGRCLLGPQRGSATTGRSSVSSSAPQCRRWALIPAPLNTLRIRVHCRFMLVRLADSVEVSTPPLWIFFLAVRFVLVVPEWAVSRYLS